jgi:gas vesicle protein
MNGEVAMIGKKWPQTVSAFGIGLGLGAVLGVLFAPKSGEEMRDSLVGNVKESLDGATAKGAKLARAAQEAVAQARENLGNAAEAGQRAYQEAKKESS